MTDNQAKKDIMYSILFLCTANRFRSPIAEATFHKLLKKQNIENDWTVESAGTWTQPGFPIIPSEEWIRDNLGLEISGHRSKIVDLKMISQFDLIVVMESNQKEALSVEYPCESHKIYMLTELTDGPIYDISDPVRQKSEEFLCIGKEIINLIEKNFNKILQRVYSNHGMKI
ncbi:MAG: hypothetical protein C4545_08955 [Anaerolineaceae bacterium]|nr:MAG: hypothetical protein C4545_08955 [Anaerolineaceae bacterium]